MSFAKSRSSSRLHYNLQSDLTIEVADALAGDIEQETRGSEREDAIVLDIRGKHLDHRVFKIFSPLGLKLRKVEKQIYTLSEDQRVHYLIRAEGMDKILNPISNLTEIKSSATKPPPKLDVAFVNPFIEGTIHVLKVQCSTEVSPGKPTLKGSERSLATTDIAGLIGITSQAFKGSIALCFPKEAFLHLMSQMLGEEFAEITDELTDGAGELINMIFGHAKKILNEQGHTLEKALPSVVRGPNLKIDHSSTHDSILLPFKMGRGEFFMEIGIEKN